MIGTFCKQVGKFDRGQMFRRYCVRCGHNSAHLGDKELRCRFLEYRIINPKKGAAILDTKPFIRIPADLRG